MYGDFEGSCTLFWGWSMGLLSKPSEYGRKLTKSEINDLPLAKWEGVIHLVQSNNQMEIAYDRLLKERILGFDVETKPVFRKGVTHQPALVQLAGSDSVTLFQINRFSNYDPLAQLLSDERVLKVGVGLTNDIQSLKSIFKFKPNTFLDLADETKRVGIESHGLRTLSARFLEFRISKRAQCSNWENHTLKPYQVSYAATDAWVSREIYLVMKRRGLFPTVNS